MKTVPSRLLLVLALSVLTVTHAAWARDLTFDERVAAQEAIERVYYSHQIGATLPFEEAVPEEILENKVRRYLEQSLALERLWDTPVTAEALRAEIQRIAERTQMPDRLREIYTALGNDPFLIEECVARPALVQRLTEGFLAFDSRFQGQARSQAEDLRRRLLTGEVDPRADEDHRSVMDLAGNVRLPYPVSGTRSPGAARSGAVAGWNRDLPNLPADGDGPGPVRESSDNFTVSVALGRGGARGRVATYTFPKMSWEDWRNQYGASLDVSTIHSVADEADPLPAARGIPVNTATVPAQEAIPTAPNFCERDFWTEGAWAGAPDGRSRHIAVWTGSEMIVWGGTPDPGVQYSPDPDFGWRYNPATDVWTPISSINAPTAQDYPVAVWTGSLMLVWGGSYNGAYARIGGRYDPIRDQWTPITKVNAPAGRAGAAAVWTGSRMVVWGGYGYDVVDSGGQYDPDLDQWTPTSRTGAPSPRMWHTAVWTGRYMVVWGGRDTQHYVAGGGRYDPASDTWLMVSASGAPASRSAHSAVWTGNQMIVWGGSRDSVPLATGGRYDPVRDVWQPVSGTRAPAARWSHTAVWTGSQMIVWGGTQPINMYPPEFNDGFRYDPVADAWYPVSSLNLPEGRFLHTAVWTGALMIVWGGEHHVLYSSPKNLSSGGRYKPSFDAWTPTRQSAPGPSARSGHVAVWTGSLMVVWGGYTASGLSNSGGRFDPVTDSWTSTRLTGAPAARSSPSAVWTGRWMTIWGGFAYGNTDSGLNSGGRYDPNSDAWLRTSTDGAPSPRYGHTGVWTGREMIIWGGENQHGSPTYEFLNTGGHYDPATDTWRPTTMTNAPVGRSGHVGVWADGVLVIWGGMGFTGTSYTLWTDGGRYDPEGDIWLPVSSSGRPGQRVDANTAWTGREVIVWSGNLPGRGDLVRDGARYDPVTDTWRPMSSLGAPAARTEAATIWTGHRLILWGGRMGNPYRDGARYDPALDAWAPMATLGAPEAGEGFSAVWAGDSLLIWGGQTDTRLLNSGGRYSAVPYLPTADPGIYPPQECTGYPGTMIELQGSGDGCLGPDHLTFTWTGDFAEGGGRVSGPAPTVTLPLGDNLLTLTVDDGNGHVATATTAIPIVDTTPPVLSCPVLASAECTSPTGAPVSLVAIASDACSPRVEIQNDRTGGGGNGSGTYPLGDTSVMFTAADASGNVSACTTGVKVVDTTPPIVTCPTSGAIECTSPAGANATLMASAADACSPSVGLTNDRTSGGADGSGTYPLGQTAVHFTATDLSGNHATCGTSVMVQDTTPPRVSSGTTPSILWPPNHRMVDVGASVAATDTCSTPMVILTSVTSSEPDDAPGGGDGNTTGDIQGAQIGTPSFGFQLRAERDGAGEGRAYRVTYTAVDGSGNQASASSIVFVPHDQGAGAEPLVIAADGGAAGTVLRWDPVPGASTYRVIRGSIGSLHDAGDFIDLGTVSCIQPASAATGTGGDEDGADPPLGETFFYLVAYDDGRDSGYGSDTATKPRLKTGGGCE